MWRYGVLLLKYPAFVVLVSLALGEVSPMAVAVAGGLSYVGACAYEIRSDAAESHRGGSMTEHVACLTCGEASSAFFIDAEDDLTGRPGRFTFVSCVGCGLVYQEPRLTLEAIRPYYDTEYIAHQESRRWGLLAPLFAAAMGSLDRAKLRMVNRYTTLDGRSSVLDVGCGSGSFLQRLRRTSGASVAGVDFVDLSARPEFEGVEFHHGLFYDQAVGHDRFDLVTMWHFLEHDYEPRRSLAHARAALKPGGTLIVEVPRLDSLSFRLFAQSLAGPAGAAAHRAVRPRSASSISSDARGSRSSSTCRTARFRRTSTCSAALPFACCAGAA